MLHSLHLLASLGILVYGTTWRIDLEWTDIGIPQEGQILVQSLKRLLWKIANNCNFLFVEEWLLSKERGQNNAWKKAQCTPAGFIDFLTQPAKRHKILLLAELTTKMTMDHKNGKKNEPHCSQKVCLSFSRWCMWDSGDISCRQKSFQVQHRIHIRQPRTPSNLFVIEAYKIEGLYHHCIMKPNPVMREKPKVLFAFSCFHHICQTKVTQRLTIIVKELIDKRIT